MVKKFILNADGFGMYKAINFAVLDAYSSNFLTSASIVPNGEFFEEAINIIAPRCPGLDIGINLNITKGKSVSQDVNLLINSNEEFCNKYFDILREVYGIHHKEFLNQIELEFISQIEKVISKTKVTHIDSYCNIHMIPPIFKIVCKLAKQYNIQYVRTHFEKFYLVPDVKKNLNINFISNLFRKFILNFLTVLDLNLIKKYNLRTNDYIIGSEYWGIMDALTVLYGAKCIKEDNIVVETNIRPCRYEDGFVNNYFDEYLIASNKNLKNKIIDLGYVVANYSEEL